MPSSKAFDITYAFAFNATIIFYVSTKKNTTRNKNNLYLCSTYQGLMCLRQVVVVIVGQVYYQRPAT